MCVTDRQYDLIVADLFQLDSAGSGTLYALKHYRNARRCLRDDGLMVQWLPMYQFFPRNLKVVMRTFANSFDHVTAWNGNLKANRPISCWRAKTRTADPFNELKQVLERGDVRRDLIEAPDPYSVLSLFIMRRPEILSFTE